jgi:hypothetical protein
MQPVTSLFLFVSLRGFLRPVMTLAHLNCGAHLNG